MTHEKRVVLIKPGDVLVIGNLGVDMGQDQLEAAIEGLRQIGLTPVVLCTEDIRLDALTDEQLAVFTAARAEHTAHAAAEGPA